MHLTGDARQALPSVDDSALPSPDFQALYLQAAAANRVRDEQVAMLAHELRNPLNALQASVEVLTRAAPDSREAVSARDIIGRQVKKLAQLVNLRLPVVGVAQPSSSAESTGHGIRVGVIEDDPDTLFGLCALLALDGHELKTAEDGPTGVAMLLREAPDVAIVDIGLPGFDGHEVARQSRMGGYGGRLIALSGYAKADDTERSLSTGFEAHLIKPVDPEALASMLRP